MKGIPALIFASLVGAVYTPFVEAGACVDHATPVEHEMVQEMNRLRKEPSTYAKELDELIPLYDGTRRKVAERTYLVTTEGAPAVEEAAAALRRTGPRKALRWDPCLSQSARDHVLDQGPGGLMGHVGTHGERLSDRVRRYQVRYRMVGENIQYGSADAAEVIRDLVIDDGVKDRGHRHNILEPAFNAAGAACGPHAKMETFCVIDFAQER